MHKIDKPLLIILYSSAAKYRYYQHIFVAKKGLLLTIIGITLGIFTGFAILILQNYIAGEIVSLLNEESEKSSGCQFKTDSIEVSLITQSATAVNPRIECGGKAYLRFSKMHAGFSLREIRNKTILLEDIKLIEGFADGVGEDSPTFKFIDSLTTSPPPDKVRADRWKARLVSLDVLNSEFTEKFGERILRGRNLNVSVKRKTETEFDILPTLEKLIWEGAARNLDLGRVVGNLTITEDKVLFHKILLFSDISRVEGQAVSDTKNHNKLSGTFDFSYLNLAQESGELLNGEVIGSGNFQGFLGRPELIGKGYLPPGSHLSLMSPMGERVIIDSLDGDFYVQTDSSRPFVEVSRLELKGENIFAEQSGPFYLKGDNLSGNYKVNFNSILREGLFFKDLKGEIVLTGTLDEPALDIDVDGYEATFYGTKFPDINVTGKLDGIRDRHKLRAALKSKFLLPAGISTIEMNGEAKVEGGRMIWDVKEPYGQITARLNIPFSMQEKSVFELNVGELANSSLAYLDQCLNFSSTINYVFVNAQPLTGEGDLKIDKFTVGCEPYTLISDRQIKLPIQKGQLSLSGLNLIGNNTSLAVEGTASVDKLDIRSTATLQLRSFLNLFPKIDDLKGHVFANVKIQGKASAPEVTGELKIEDGQLDVESSNISANDVSGKVALINNYLEIEGLSGTLNGGEVNLKGGVHPFNAEKSELLLNFKNVYTNPLEGLNLELSGDLAIMRLDDSSPVITGDVNIERGEFQRNIELTSVIRSIPAYLLGKSKSESADVLLPDLELDIKIKAGRNLFIFTNWLNAELQADLDISGNLNQPSTSGRVEVLNGWVGFRDRTFEINSGKLIFKPGQREPYLELISETFVNSRSGSNVQVILEASGNIAAPKITLTSDRALTEQQLLALITSGQNLSTQTRANSIESSLDFSEGKLDYGDMLLSPRSLVEFITQIDTLAIEPSYNSLSGAIDPAIVARKKLLDRLFLEGKSFLGSSNNLSRAQLVYNLSRSVNVAGLMESVSSRKETALELNSTYTILSNQSKNLDLTLEGDEELSEISLLNHLRINENSRIPCEQIIQIKENIGNFYREHAYFETDVQVDADCKFNNLSTLKVNLVEGKKSIIKEIIFSGDPVNKIIDLEEILDDVQDSPATEDIIKTVEAKLIKGLRNEGYISSRTKIKYSQFQDTSDKILSINVFLGKPVSFTFTGNKVFTARDFLDTINLFNRKLPLGSNTINLLTEAMERKYRDAGYLYATIRDQKLNQTDERINYIIHINEGEAIKVTEVKVEGNEILTTERIKELLLKRDPALFQSFFLPEIVQAEVIESNILSLKEIYQTEGFVGVTVDYQLVPAGDSNTISIVYKINEGKEQKSDWIEVLGLPPEVPYVKPLESSYSIEKANQIIDDLTSQLHNQGYLNSSYSTDYKHERQQLSVYFSPGNASRVDTIEIEGNVRIQEEVIMRYVSLKSGDRWDNDKIQDSRKKLLRLGLFNRVEFTPKDGSLDQEKENLVIKVYERPLQSLQVGAGANSALGTHIFSQATDRSLFKDGKSLSLNTDLYYDPREQDISQGIAGFVYTHPNFYGSDYTLTEDVRYQKLETSAQEFDLDRSSLASYFYRNFTEEFTFSLGHTILDENLENVTPGAIIGEFDEGNVRLGFISGFLTLDERDLPLNPSRGYALNFDYKIANRGLGSQADFYSLGTRASYIHPFEKLDNRFSFAANTRIAGSWTYSDTDEIPISQRYYTGGRLSIRGFRENALGPRGDDGAVIGGDSLFANNFEFRFLAADNTSLHTFFDAGTVFLRERSFSFNDIRTSVGVGIRYLSPIGPIGFDIGHPLDEQSGEPSVRFHFNIGSNF